MWTWFNGGLGSGGTFGLEVLKGHFNLNNPLIPVLSPLCSYAWVVPKTPILGAVRAADALTLHNSSHLPNNSRSEIYC